MCDRVTERSDTWAVDGSLDAKKISQRAGAACAKIGAVVVTLAASSSAQVRCVDVTSSVMLANSPSAIAMGDLNGDGIADVAGTLPFSDFLVYAFASPSGGIGTAFHFSSGGWAPSSVVITDVDGDQDLDIACTNGGSPQNNLRILRNDGTGSFVMSLPVAASVGSRSLVSADFDGDLDQDLACCSGSLVGQLAVYLNPGSGTFGAPVTYGFGAGNVAVAAGDVDADLDVDLVVSKASPFGLVVYVNQGNGTFVPGATQPTGGALEMLKLVDLDGDGDLDVVGARTSTHAVALAFNNSSGGFGAETSIALGSGTFPSCVAPCDVDLDGDFDLYVSKGVGASSVELIVNSGGGAFAPPQSVVSGAGNIAWLACADLEGDGDDDLVLAASTTRLLTIQRNCALSGDAFCAGDGSSTACPCGNTSAPGADAGCSSSIGTGATLRANGAARITSDAIVLTAAQLPATAPAIYVQGNARAAGGAGLVFGDGLLCVDVSLVRLAVKFSTGGTSSFPAPGDPSLSVQGGVTLAGERFYQAWYRDSASFCTSATYNLSNGWRVVWGP